MNLPIDGFLRDYEDAISRSDASAIAAQYSDVFMFADPQGVRPVRKEDFLKAIPRRKEWFTSIGLTQSKLISADEMRLDSRYSLVKTVWKMSFGESSGLGQDIETSATYVLEWTDGTVRIVFQIDHQDLAARVRDLAGHESRK